MQNLSMFIHDVKRVIVEKVSRKNGKGVVQTMRLRVLTDTTEFTLDAFGPDVIRTESVDEIGTVS